MVKTSGSVLKCEWLMECVVNGKSDNMNINRLIVSTVKIYWQLVETIYEINRFETFYQAVFSHGKIFTIKKVKKNLNLKSIKH